VFWTVAVILSGACDQRERASQAGLGIGALAAYIEARSDAGLFASPFGDVVVLDLRTGERRSMTHDTFYDERPSWSSDGKAIRFLASREGGEKYLGLTGLSAKRQLYEINLESGETEKLAEGMCGTSENNSPPLTMYGRLYDGSVLMRDGDRKLIQMDVPSHNCKVIVEGFTPGRIYDVWISQDGYSAALQYTTRPPGGPLREGVEGLVVLGVKDSKLVPIVDSALTIIVEGWSQDGKSLYYFTGGQMLSLNLVTLKSAPIQMPKKAMDVFGSDLVVLPGNDLLFISSDDKSPTGAGEIVFYRKSVDSLEYITRTGRLKAQLSLRALK
jgi:hypothetical protein